MDLNQIRYFLALADTLNFTRAAERCHVSQPALTQSIKRLESELGGDLIHRNGLETKITPLGKSLRGYFEQIDRTKKLALTTARAMLVGEIAELHIGIMCTLGPRLLARMLDEFQMTHPQVSLILHDVKPEEISSLLLSGKLDGAFCSYRELPGTGMQLTKLFDENMVLAIPKGHELSKLETVPLCEIAGHRYVDRLHCELRQMLFGFFESKELELNIVFRSEREDWIQSLIRDGIGISVIPVFSLLRPELDYRKVTEPELSRTVQFATLEQSEVKPVLETFTKLMDMHDWQSNYATAEL